MTESDDGAAHWYEDETGPMVRPYTVTHGRTRPDTDHPIDLMAPITAVEEAEPEQALDHARTSLLELIRRGSRPLAELAADADLPLTVVRVLLGDLVDAGLVRIGAATTPADRPDAGLLREVVARLREL
ncbi:DUF742 domain-containing protein [Streptomyces sp. NPDC002055]|uniref:DUF742 domain-containing protein n=1 Tax=Streptomyces sp. NPDC002055 TaxID=3154534 RepID=UPI0033176373